MSKLELIDRNILNIPKYVAGKSIEETAKIYGIDPNNIIKLGSNENVLGPSKKSIEAIKNVVENIYLYPSVDANELVHAISQYTQIPTENICASGPGMDGLLDNLMRLLIQKGDEVIIPIPTFSYYEISAAANGANIIYNSRKEDMTIDIDGVCECITPKTKVIFLCSPNNPSGDMISESDLKKIVSSFEGIVFLDEAYVDFANSNMGHLVQLYDNLVIGRTFSKIFGLAGLRLGYGIMPQWLKNEYLKVVTPFNVSLPAIVAGIAALSDSYHIERTYEMVKRGRKFFHREIPFKVYHSMANFVLVDVTPFTAEYVCDYLLKQGIIVRNCSSFKGANDSLIRITVGTDEQNIRVVEAFRNI